MADVVASASSLADIVRLESIERDAWLDMYAAAPAAFAAAAGLSATRVGSGAVFAIRAVPLVQFNHAHALGLGPPLDGPTLAEAIGVLAAKASQVWAMQLPDLPEFSEAASRLKARGFSTEGGWEKFSRATSPP